jgi:hypothetical protein
MMVKEWVVVSEVNRSAPSHTRKNTAYCLTSSLVPAAVHRLHYGTAEGAILLEMDDGFHNLVGRRALIRHGGLFQDESLGVGLAREADGVDGGGIDRDHRRLVIELEGHVDCV